MQLIPKPTSLTGFGLGTGVLVDIVVSEVACREPQEVRGGPPAGRPVCHAGCL